MPIKKTILIVEDESSLLRALDIKMLDSGFKVLVASDGETGLKMIKVNKPDLVLLDLLMPKMDGFTVLEKAKKDPKTKDIPIIALSNLGEKENIEKAMKLGAVAYFVKAETDLGQLIKKIKSKLKV